MNEKLQEIIASLKRSNEKYTIIGDVNVGMSPLVSNPRGNGDPNVSRSTASSSSSSSSDPLISSLTDLIKKLDSRLENFGKGVRRSLFDISKIGEPFKNFAGGIQSIVSAPVRAFQESVGAIQETFASIGSGIKNAIGGIFSRFSTDKEKLAQTELLQKISTKTNEQFDSISRLIKISEDGFGGMISSFRRVAEIMKGDELQQIENQRKNFALFTDISESLGGIEQSATTSAKSSEEGGLFGFLPVVTLKTLKAFAMTALKGAGIAGLVGLAVTGVIGAVRDAFAGFDWATEIGVERVTGGIAGFLGGKRESESITNALAKAGQFARIGALAGLPFGGIPGAIGGALVGAGVGGILGWIGAENIANFMDPVVKTLKRAMGVAIDVTNAELLQATNLTDEIKEDIKQLEAQIEQQAQRIKDAALEGKPPEEITRLQEELSKSYDELDVLNRRRQSAVDEQLQIERDLARNEKVAAKQKFIQLKDQLYFLDREQFQTELQLRQAEEGSEKHQRLTAKLESLQREEERLNEQKAAAEETLNEARDDLLEKDRKIVEKAREEGRSAPIGSQFNVMMADIRDWWKENIYDGGPPKKIFGVELPSFKDIGEKWNNLNSDLSDWWKNNIYDSTPGVDGFKIFGYTIPSLATMSVIGFTKMEEAISNWWKNNIYDSEEGKIFGMPLPEFNLPSLGDIKDKLLSWLPWPFNPNADPPEPIDWNEEVRKETKAAAAIEGIGMTQQEVYDDVESKKELEDIAQKMVDAGFYGSVESALEGIKNLGNAIMMEGASIRDYLPAEEYRSGTGGFMDFGRESLAKLHGVEAVIPRESPQGRLVEAFSSPRERRIDKFVDVITTIPRQTGLQMEATQRETSAATRIAAMNPTQFTPPLVTTGQSQTTNNNTRLTVNQANHIDPTMKSVLGNSF
jgi:hypothetical protein